MKILVPKRYAALSPMCIPVFIAGPIGGGDDRQADFIRLVAEYLKQCAPVTLYQKIEPRLLFICPCRWGDNHPLATHFEKSFTLDSYGQDQEAESQTFWEAYYGKGILTPESQGFVVFLLFPESATNPRTDGQPYGRDSMGELGRWSMYAHCVGASNIHYALHEKWSGRTVFEKNLRFWTPEQTRNIHRSMNVNHFAEHFADVLIRKFSN